MFSFYTRRTQSKNRKQKLYKIVIETDEYAAYRFIQDAARSVIDAALIRRADMITVDNAECVVDKLSKCLPRATPVP